LIGFLAFLFCGDFVANAVWSVSHRRAASFRGQTLKLPWLWREEAWTNYNEFDLTRRYVGVALPSTAMVRYVNLSKADVPREIDGFRRLYANLSSKAPGTYTREDLIDAIFVCEDQGSNRSQILFINCISRDGRWRVTFIGLERSRSNFEMILKGVASMGTPSK
jgi:hypothetical protein